MPAFLRATWAGRAQALSLAEIGGANVGWAGLTSSGVGLSIGEGHSMTALRRARGRPESRRRRALLKWIVDAVGWASRNHLWQIRGVL